MKEDGNISQSCDKTAINTRIQNKSFNLLYGNGIYVYHLVII
jgi:hypothetical protein